MRTCRECRDRLSAYREGELDDSLRKKMDGHLAGCADCRAELAGLNQMIQQLKGLPPVSVPSDFRSRVWQKIEEEPWTARLRRTILEPWYLKLPVEALATAAVVLIVAQVVRVTGPEKMAMAPLLQETPVSAPLDKAKLDTAQGVAANGKLKERAVSEMAREKQQEQRMELAAVKLAPAGLPLKDAEQPQRSEMESWAVAGQAMKQGRSAESPSVMAADQALLRTYMELDLFASDLGQARQALADLISRTPHAEGSFSKEDDLYFISLPDEQLNAFLIELFEIGSFEPTRTDSGWDRVRRPMRTLQIHLRRLEP